MRKRFARLLRIAARRLDPAPHKVRVFLDDTQVTADYVREMLRARLGNV